MKKSRKHKTPYYSDAQATKWLSWMAKNMQQHDQTVFLIEDLQASWLPNKFERIAHWTFSIIFTGLITWLITGLIFGLVDGLFDGLAIGLFTGLIFSIGEKNNLITTVEGTFWSWKNLTNNYKDGFIKGAFNGLILGLTFGVIFGMFNDLTGGFDGSLAGGLAGGLAFGLAGGLGGGLAGGLAGGLIGGLIGIIASGWKKEVHQTTTMPNEGIKLTLKSSGKGLIFGLITGLIFGLILGLNLGLIGAIIGGLWLGGMSVIRHYMLRFFIYLKGDGPLNYANFLDYCVDEIQFLQRVGGGYIFIHRMLLEHFASMEESQTLIDEGQEKAPEPVSA